MIIYVSNGEDTFTVSKHMQALCNGYGIAPLAVNTVEAHDPNTNTTINFTFVYGTISCGMVCAHSIPENKSRTIEIWAEDEPLTKTDIIKARATELGVPYVDVAASEVDARDLHGIPSGFVSDKAWSQ